MRPCGSPVDLFTPLLVDGCLSSLRSQEPMHAVQGAPDPLDHRVVVELVGEDEAKFLLVDYFHIGGEKALVT